MFSLSYSLFPLRGQGMGGKTTVLLRWAWALSAQCGHWLPGDLWAKRAVKIWPEDVCKINLFAALMTVSLFAAAQLMKMLEQSLPNHFSLRQPRSQQVWAEAVERWPSLELPIPIPYSKCWPLCMSLPLLLEVTVLFALLHWLMMWTSTRQNQLG